MDVLVAVLICAILFLLYLLNENKNEVLRLKREQRENERDNIARPPTKNFQPQLPPPSSGIFVSVIFKQNDRKSYDYLLGNIDVQVGDFVVVNVNDKIIGERKWRIAQIVYISQPGEVSPYAKSFVVKKADYPKW